MKKLILFALAVALAIPLLVSAKIGVGIGTGKIVVDQQLKAGLIYNIPNLVVINTGDEPSDYSVGTQRVEGQKEFIPAADWFSFEPDIFYLEPGQTQIVKIKLTLPIRGAKPGDYFSFVQAYPVKKEMPKGTSVGVAAAAKLYFSVSPANFFQGIYYRLASLIVLTAPWSYIVFVLLAIATLGVLIQKNIKFKVSIGRK
ncbi:MAG: hypothetical protein C3F02_01480 [Parcubacteria group bacterium]|nr:MAG: hypothetical protein C3F02_01480 [Parcubacteria group bacterium]